MCMDFLRLLLATFLTARIAGAAAENLDNRYSIHRGTNTASFLRDPEHGCALSLASHHHRPSLGSINCHPHGDCIPAHGVNPSWVMYRDDPTIDGAITATALSTVGWQPTLNQLSHCIFNASVPGTALTSLLRNGTFGNFTSSDDGASSTSGSGGSSSSSSDDIVDRVYVDDNLASVPDINATGRGFYTFWYRTEVTLTDTSWNDCLSDDSDAEGFQRGSSSSNHSKMAALWFVLEAANYRVQNVYVNGAPAVSWEESIDEGYDNWSRELDLNRKITGNGIGSAKEATPGMFLRRRFRVRLPTNETASASSVVALAFCVQPPDHPGYVGNGGQGGDHSLAMDGAIMQSAAGWDWIAPAPDRNTGPWGNVLLAATFVQDSSGTSADTSADSDVAAQLQKSQNSLRGNELPQIDAKSGLIEDVVNESNVELRCVLALTDGAVWTEALLDAHGNDYPDRSSGVGRHSSAGEGESQSNPELLGLSGARIKASVIVANLGAPSLRAAGSFSTGNAYDDACPFQLEVVLRDTDGNIAVKKTVTFEEKLRVEEDGSLAPGTSREVAVELTIPAESLRLWWPHKLLLLGEHSGINQGPHLYTARFTATETIAKEYADSSKQRAYSAYSSLSVPCGIRTVGSWFDPVTQGRAFSINGVKIYLEGGNWIATDALLRYATHPDRYLDEVGLHVSMGFNLIRVWGGGLVETRDFYDSCNTLGVLVYQELQMTGDNNGRWAGSYDWPLDQSAYLRNARDSFKRLRRHPSLLLVGGGNELSPQELNPPPYIAQGLIALANELLPPGVTYIASSMAPQNYSQPFDWTYAMAPNDGNYGLNWLGTYWSDRNPGLEGARNVSIAFQPEIGNAAVPMSRRGLARFLSPSAMEAIPLPGATFDSADPAWVYHKYLGMTTTVTTEDDSNGDSANSAETMLCNSPETAARCARAAIKPQISTSTMIYDHVYAYGPADSTMATAEMGWNATTWVQAANMALHQQYQALIEGFAAHAFEWYSGVVMWKSQSPWPSLRGQLYDSSLEQSGGFWGIQRATSNNLRESDLVALAAYFVSKYNTSRSAAANGDDAAAEGAEGGAAAAKGGAYERRTVESERRGGFYCSRSQNRGPPLHVQINPMNLVCAVINRGRHVYPSPHTPFPANSTSGRSDISNLAKETTYVFTVRADFRTLYGIQAVPAQARTVGGPCSGNHSGTCFQAAAATLCDGLSFEWPSLNESTAKGKADHDYIEKNVPANNSGWGTLLLDLELWQSTATSNENLARSTNHEPEGVVVARNHYWLSDRPATLLAPSSLVSPSSSSSSRMGDKRTISRSTGDYRTDYDASSDAASNVRGKTNNYGPAKAPNYANLWALKMDGSTSIPQISLRVNGSATTKKCAIQNGSCRISSSSVSRHHDIHESSDYMESNRRQLHASNCETGANMAHISVDVAHPGPADGTQPSAIYVCLALLKEANISSPLPSQTDSNQAWEPVLPVFWGDNCATVLPGEQHRFTGWARLKASTMATSASTSSSASSGASDSLDPRASNLLSTVASSLKHFAGEKRLTDTEERPTCWFVEASCWNCNTVVVALSEKSN